MSSSRAVRDHCRAVALSALLLGSLLGQATVQPLTVIRSQYIRISVPTDIQRVAVGDSDIATAEVINTREVLVLGKSAGRTSLIVWFRNGNTTEYLATVQRDFAVLQAALHRIHPAIEAEPAPDRDAVILTGIVPDITYSRAAEGAAQSYMNASQGGAAGRPLILAPAQAAPPQGPPQPGAQTQPQAPPAIQVPTVAPQPSPSVINLIQLETLPPLPEQRIRDIMRSIGGIEVTVERILKGPVRDDSRDVLLFRGTVPNQVALIRILTVAAQVFAGRTINEDDIRVVADESGALSSLIAGQGQQAGQFGLGGGGGGASQLFGGGQGGGNGRLGNQIQRNIGRAKALEAAEGRILSFIQVADLPQVRVDVRVYEVNRSKLRTYNANLVTLLSNRATGSLSPSTPARVVQGQGAPRIGENGRSQVQAILSFLSGTLGGELQVATTKFAIDAAFSLLEQQGLARTLSSPSLTVLSGEQAQFQVGGEIPIPESFVPVLGGVTTGGGSTVTTGTTGIFQTINFVPFGIQLTIRPLVEENEMITLDLLPRVVTPDAELTASIKESTGTNVSTTAFQTRSLRTSARLQDGQALLLGGLYSHDTNDTRAATPGLSDAPGLGWLFKGFNRSDNATELVVVLNPVVLRPPSPSVPLWQFPDGEELLLGLQKQR